MQLLEVISPALVRRFHAVPKGIYRNDPQWIPYLRQDIEKLFDPKKNKLFREGATARRWILVGGNGQDIGRIAAFVNPKNSDTGTLKSGGLGFFECIHDSVAAGMLFDAARDWLQAQGMQAMDGPINFGDRSQFWGCQVSNWEEPAIYPMNYNPPYYSALFEQYGFGIYFKQYLYWRSLLVDAQPIFHRKYHQLKSDPDFEVRNVRGMKTSAIAADFRTVYNAAWGGHSHFKEMSAAAAQKVFKAIGPALDKEIVIFAYYKGEPIGFYVNIPELNQIFRHVDGNLNWWGKIKFLYHRFLCRTSNRMTGLVFGVVKSWQGKGVEAAMIVYAGKTIVNRGTYKDTVLTWIGDFNPKMIKVAENLDTSLWRTLHTYRYQFDRSLPFERAPIVQ